MLIVKMNVCLFVQGMIDPAVQSLWAVWGPRSEVAFLTAVEYGGKLIMCHLFDHLVERIDS